MSVATAARSRAPRASARGVSSITRLRWIADRKLRGPVRAAGLVPRGRLVQRLAGAGDVPLALIVAPAGYGKTTLLAEWADHDPSPFAWVTLDEGDNDPHRLLASLALALDGIEPVEAHLLDALMSPDPDVAASVLPGMIEAISRRRPFVLALDDAELVQAPGALETLRAILDHLPRGSRLALASREEPRIGVGGLRAHRRLVELRVHDLVMSRDESEAMLTGLGVRARDVDVLVERTEGWPAGLYLAGLSLRDRPDPDHAVAGFAGTDRLVTDYVRDEVLARLSAEQVRFLIRTSVLDELNGPRCDAVLATSGSARTLRDLARSNVMLVPLDAADDRYRFHRLFAETLRAELSRTEPRQEAVLHRRASAWHAGQGTIGAAIHHAVAAGDVGRAADLLWSIAADHVTNGGEPFVQRWLERFTPEQVAGHAPLALAAATCQLATGDRDLMEHWARAAERRPAAADGAGVVAVLRATVARDGISAMGDEAERAYRLGHEDGPWRALSCLLQGVARHLTGDAERARELLEEGARRGAVAAPSIQVLCLAQLGLLVAEGDDWDTAEVFAARARAQVERVGLDRYATSALVFATSAMICAQRGRVEQARSDAKEGTRLLTRLTDFAPWYEAEVRVALARAALRLSDVVGARTLLAEASRAARRTPDAVVLTDWLAESWAQADSFSAAVIMGPSSLTTAELRVLGMLPTHLSFREIGGRLHVSGNTIKTQAHAVYRKLDASSRTEAVANARRVGLLDA